MSSNRRRIRKVVLIATPLLLGVVLVGCIGISNGTWYVKSAATPEHWPELTPIGTVEVKTYPPYRAASVSAADVNRGGMGPMFMTLFRHIDENQIAMTAPVNMEFEQERATQEMTSMSFLYRTAAVGDTGPDGAVSVEDVEPCTVASVGVRGDYTVANFNRGLSQLREWLEQNPQYEESGRPRYLGYNSPFVPKFARYGEVQIPLDRDQE